MKERLRRANESVPVQHSEPSSVHVDFYHYSSYYPVLFPTPVLRAGEVQVIGARELLRLSELSGETHTLSKINASMWEVWEAFLEEGASKLTPEGQPGANKAYKGTLGQSVPGKENSHTCAKTSRAWQTSHRMWGRLLSRMYDNYAINYKLLAINV